MKRGYMVSDLSQKYAVVAHTATEAKGMAWREKALCQGCLWIDLKAKWIRDAEVDDLPFGVIAHDAVAIKHNFVMVAPRFLDYVC